MILSTNGVTIGQAPDIASTLMEAESVRFVGKLLLWLVLWPFLTPVHLWQWNVAGKGIAFAWTAGLTLVLAGLALGLDPSGLPAQDLVASHALRGSESLASDRLVPERPAKPSADVQAQAELEAQVVQVLDGETIQVAVEATTCVRYLLVDAPEDGRPLAEEAAARNRALVAGQTVRLERDISWTDREGRLLRYVYLPDGRMVNEILAREGYVRLSTIPPDLRHETVIRAAQQEAQAASRGIWLALTATPGSHPMPP